MAQLGAIRALLQAVMNFSTAIDPPVFGNLLHRGLPTNLLAGGIGAGILIVMLLAAVALYADRQNRANG